MRHLRSEGITVGRHRIRRLMRRMGIEATYRRPRTSIATPEHRIFPLSAPGSDDHAGGPRLVCKHHVCPCDTGLFLLGGCDGLGDPASARVAAVEHDGCPVLRRGAGRRAGPGDAGDTQHRSRIPVHQRGVHRPGARSRCALLDGRPRPVPRQHLHRAALAVAQVRGGLLPRALRRAGHRADDGSWVSFYNELRPHSALGGRTPGETYREGTVGS